MHNQYVRSLKIDTLEYKKVYSPFGVVCNDRYFGFLLIVEFQITLLTSSTTKTLITVMVMVTNLVRELRTSFSNSRGKEYKI